MRNPVLSWLAVGTLSLLLGACATPQAPATAQTPSTAQPESSADTVNQSLDQMARYFAQAVTDPGLRSQIRDLAAERFDGDTNVLYQTLAARSDVRGLLAQAVSGGLGAQGGAAPATAHALALIETLAAEIPRFQVAVPVHFDSWDAASHTPLVGFMPEGVDDMALKTITAYDAQGRVHTLDARVEPKVPIIILSMNERTDDEGNVLQEFRAADTAAPTLSAQGNYQVRVVGVGLIDDMEPWSSGDAEVMLVAKGPGLFYHGPFQELNHKGDYRTYNRNLDTSSGDVNFYWYENDAGSVGLEVDVKGYKLGVEIGNGDDRLGAIRLDNSLFKGTTENKRDLGGVIQWTD